MTVSASARNRLFNRLREQYGDDDAATLMDLLPPGGWDEVATRADVRELRAEMHELRAEMHEGFARAVTREELADLLRVHVDARVGQISRWWLFSTMAMQAATIAGVIAAVRL
jgi:hypothetical protein